MAEIGYASLAIIPSFKGFERALQQGTTPHLMAAGATGGDRFGGSFADQAGRKFNSRFSTLLKTGAAAAAGAAVGGAFAAFKIGSDAIEEASDLGESLNALRVSYDQNARAVGKLGEQAAESLGLSNTEFNALAVRFSAFSRTIAGGGGKKVVRTLDDLTTRAADFASVMNLEVGEAAELFQSGLAGETEPLRKFGIDLSAAAVEAYAYAKGIADVGDKLTESEKVQARYGSLMEQTRKTHGDFANTSDSLANQQRILNARWDDAKAKLGTSLLPIMEDATGFLNREGIPVFEKFATWFGDKGIPAVQDFANEMAPLAREVLPAAGHALGTVRDFLADAAPYAKDFVGYFNDMPDWAKTLLVGGGAGVAVGKKLGLGKLAGKAGETMFSKATPLPVFVTNPGFGGPGGGAAAAGKGGKGAMWALGAASLYVTGAVTVSAASAKFIAGKSVEQVGPENASALAAGSQGGGMSLPAKAYDLFDGIEEKASEASESAARLQRIMRGIGNRDTRARFYAQGLDELIEATEEFRGHIESLDGRTVRVFYKSVGDKIDRQLDRFGGFRANGGPVDPSRYYMVGERGPELFAPTTPGRIISNREASRGAAGGVQFSGPIHVEAHDYRDFMQQIQRRAHAVAGGGVAF